MIKEQGMQERGQARAGVLFDFHELVIGWVMDGWISVTRGHADRCDCEQFPSSPGLRFSICRVRELNQVNLKTTSNLNTLCFAAKTEQKYCPGCGPKKEETQKER